MAPIVWVLLSYFFSNLSFLRLCPTTVCAPNQYKTSELFQGSNTLTAQTQKLSFVIGLYNFKYIYLSMRAYDL